MQRYTSTRSKTTEVTAPEAILKGISDEGGLFVPTAIPKKNFELEDMLDWSYTQLAQKIMSHFFEDLGEAQLNNCIECAYDDKFACKGIVDLKKVGEEGILELFHGPTLAFKDMALSVLPHLMLASKAVCKNDQETVILAATSGDTGKAALEGFAGVEGTKIIVFFPEDGVSDVQKKQMVTQAGDNTRVIGIYGNFDDAQTGVKKMLGDVAFKEALAKKGYAFSSANSINIGRLVPQIVYYFEAYKNMVNTNQIASGDQMNVVVPTGNFGNILAGYYAKQMGLPINKLICASNKNKVLFDFLQTGEYDANRAFYVTNSPSMDILISSNLERLLYHLSGEDTDVVSELMQSLKEEGRYNIPKVIKDNLKDFYGGYADEEQTEAMIAKVYKESNYLMDTHTAVAYVVYEDYKAQTGDLTKTVIVSTASPYKFTQSVMGSLDEANKDVSERELLVKMEQLLNEEMPEGVKDLFTKPILHTVKCDPKDMARAVDDFLI